MAKVLPTLAIFALTVNLFAGVMVTTGAAATLGVTTEVGGDRQVEQAQEEAGGFESGAPTGQTLFGMYNVIAGVLATIAAPVTALPNMLRRLGTPGAITGMLQGLLVVIYGLGVASFLRGYSLQD